MAKIILSETQVNNFFAKLAPATAPTAINDPKYNKAHEWPNRLGFDIGNYEAFKRSDGGFCVKSDDRSAIVTSTNDPVEAVRITRERGFIVVDLEEMEPVEALRVFLSKNF